MNDNYIERVERVESQAQGLAPVLTRVRREPIKAIKRQGRNEQCACGSGKKYKKCCLEVDNKIIARAEEIAKKQNEIVL